MKSRKREWWMTRVEQRQTLPFPFPYFPFPLFEQAGPGIGNTRHIHN